MEQVDEPQRKGKAPRTYALVAHVCVGDGGSLEVGGRDGGCSQRSVGQPEATPCAGAPGQAALVDPGPGSAEAGTGKGITYGLCPSGRLTTGHALLTQTSVTYISPQKLCLLLC